MKLIDLHKNKTGKLSDKWESYLVLYEELFEKFRNQEVSIVEIGVKHGGSLETWSEYFTNAVKIIGIDCDQKCSELKYEDSKIKVYIQDGKIPIAGSYDIIIDDGSHKSEDLVEQFKSWFQYLKAGGLYIVEDLHTMWLPGFGTGAQKFFSDLIIDINREWHSIESFNIKSMQIVNSLVIITKGESKIGERLKCGYEKLF